MSSALSVPSAPPPISVFFPCTGLGRQRRGFETFTSEFAHAMRDHRRVRVSVFAGGGEAEQGLRVLSNLPRDSRAAAVLGVLLRHEPYFIEQAGFFLSLLPHLVRERPDVVYFGDLNLGNLCWHWRRLTGARYRLLFYNGGAMSTPYTRMDFVQQLTPSGLSDALARGEDASRQIVLPHGVLAPGLLPPRITGQDRASLGLPADRRIVLSVGMLDVAVKRMDYLIREVAALEAPRPYLVLLGAASGDTPALRALANALLGDDGCMLATVDRRELSRFYRAADVFALASRREGFGLAYVEALLHGLPVVAHDSPVTRYVLGAHGDLRDLTKPGAATVAIQRALGEPLDDRDRQTRFESARDRFGWNTLRDRYADMLVSVGGVPLVGK